MHDELREKAAQAAASAYYPPHILRFDLLPPLLQGRFRRVADAVAEVLDADTAPRIQWHHMPAPETTAAPIVLPTVDDFTEAIIKSQSAGGWLPRTAAQAVLDLIASRVPVWQPVEPGDIKVGMRVRLVTAKGDEAVYTVTWRDREWINGADETRDVGIATHTWFIDPRTVPAEPEDPRIERARAIIPALQRVKNVPLGGDLLPAALEAIERLDALEADR